MLTPDEIDAAIRGDAPMRQISPEFSGDVRAILGGLALGLIVAAILCVGPLLHGCVMEPVATYEVTQ